MPPFHSFLHGHLTEQVFYKILHAFASFTYRCSGGDHSHKHLQSALSLLYHVHSFHITLPLFSSSYDNITQSASITPRLLFLPSTVIFSPSCRFSTIRGMTC